MQSVRIILCQKRLGDRISHDEAAIMADYRPHFCCYPEYFFVNRALGNHAQTAHNQRCQLQRIEILSRKLGGVVVGGTMPELSNGTLFNTAYVYHDGQCLGFYRKRNLFFAEVGTIAAGDSLTVFSAYGIRFCVLICADVFIDEYFAEIRRRECRIVFIPTFSLRRDETVEEKHRRDQDIFVRGARLSGAVIVKVCGAPSPYKDFLQARSLVAAPSGVLFRVAADQENASMLIRQEIML